jgi:phosphoenolpyruvate-protein kinase (PTS system EI component)
VAVGAMVETVEAVGAIAALCRAADFLSIGTNDLTAAVLDLNRRDPRARPELTAHPYVLDLVGRVVDAGRLAGRPVSVCGDSAAHPLTLPLLLGAGVRAVSVSCARVDETRYRLRRLDTRRCAEVYADALHRRTAEEALALVSDRIRTELP